VILKKLLVAVFIFGLFIKSGFQVLFVGSYWVNLEAYKAKCVNLDKPDMHCNGQCQWMQEIREKAEKENPKPLYYGQDIQLDNYVHFASTEFVLKQPFETSLAPRSPEGHFFSGPFYSIDKPPA